MNLNVFRKKEKDSINETDFPVNCEKCGTQLKKKEKILSKKLLKDTDGVYHFLCLSCVIQIAKERNILKGKLGQIVRDKMN